MILVKLVGKVVEISFGLEQRSKEEVCAINTGIESLS